MISGCAGSPHRLSGMNEFELESVTDKQLDRTLRSRSVNQLIVDEAELRELYTREELIEILNDGSPLQMSLMDRKQLASMTDQEISNAIRFPYVHTDLIEDEAADRGLFTHEDMYLIKLGEIGVGMSEKALLVVWGKPRKINRTVGSYGTHKQYIYKKFASPERRYVYVKNGKVTGWQD